MENSYRSGRSFLMIPTIWDRVVSLKSHCTNTGRKGAEQTAQLLLGFTIFSPVSFESWFFTHTFFCLDRYPMKNLYDSVTSNPLTMELVLAIAGMILPAILLME